MEQLNNHMYKLTMLQSHNDLKVLAEISIESQSFQPMTLITEME
jgi:hypothetical protein